MPNSNHIGMLVNEELDVQDGSTAGYLPLFGRIFEAKFQDLFINYIPRQVTMTNMKQFGP